MAPSASVTFTSVPTSITKGSKGIFNTTSTGSLANATLYWKIVHGTTDDSNFSAVTGSYTASGAGTGTGSFSIVTQTDVLHQADLTFTVSVYQDSGYTNLRATSASVNLDSPPSNRYWVGGGGTWDGSSQSHWSTSSGGSGGASIPTAANAVFFDSNSGSEFIIVGFTISGSAVECASLDCTGFTGTMTTIPAYFDGLGFNVYGNVTLSSGGTYFLTPYGGSSGGSGFGVNMIGTGTLTTVGKTISGLTVGDGSTPTTTTLGDNLSIQPASNSGASFTFYVAPNSTFNANNFNIQTMDFNIFDPGAGNSITINMGSGTWQLWDDGNAFGWNINFGYPITDGTITINPETSTIQMGGRNSGYGASFYGMGYTYYNLTITGKVQGIQGNNTFNTITTNYIEGVKTIYFEAGSTQTVTNFNVGNGWTLKSTTTGTSWNLSKASGTVSVDYLSIQDSNATGGAAWYAGTHSTNVSNNSGWTFTAPPVPSATNSNFLQFF